MYEGMWKNNKMEGFGRFEWPDGKFFEGEYSNDKKDGFGIFSWPDGRIYKGMWKNGKQHGEGDYYNPYKKEWKKGVWEYGKRVKWIETNVI